MPSSEATAKARQVHDQLRPADHRQSDDWRGSCSACDAIASALDEFAAAVVTGVAKSYKRMVDDELDARDAAVARAEAAERKADNWRDISVVAADKRQAAERRVAELEAALREIGEGFETYVVTSRGSAAAKPKEGGDGAE